MITVFNQNFIDSFVLPKKKITFFDKNTKYLAIISTKTSARYYFIKRIDKKVLYIQIANINEISLNEAKERIIEIYQEQLEIAKIEKNKPKPKITLQNVFDCYIKYKQIKGDAHHGIECALSRWKLHVPEKLKKMPYNEILPIEFENNTLELGAKGIKRTANLLTIDLTAAYNYYFKVNSINSNNPLANVTRFHDKQRERVLSMAEITRFFSALNESESKLFIDFIKVSLFTGKRKSRILAMKWEQIDLERKVWTIPAMINKNKTTDVVLLDDIVVEILKQRQGNKCPWVFESENLKSHYKAPENAWKSLRKRAMLQDVVMHDLRRTLASVMADNNCSLHIIGQVLNHKSLHATPIYARVQQNAKRSALNSAVNIIASAGGLAVRQHTATCLQINNIINRDEQMATDVLNFIHAKNLQKVQLLK